MLITPELIDKSLCAFVDEAVANDTLKELEKPFLKQIFQNSQYSSHLHNPNYNYKFVDKLLAAKQYDIIGKLLSRFPKLLRFTLSHLGNFFSIFLDTLYTNSQHFDFQTILNNKANLSFKKNGVFLHPFEFLWLLLNGVILRETKARNSYKYHTDIFMVNNEHGLIFSQTSQNLYSEFYYYFSLIWASLFCAPPPKKGISPTFDEKTIPQSGFFQNQSDLITHLIPMMPKIAQLEDLYLSVMRTHFGGDIFGFVPTTSSTTTPSTTTLPPPSISATTPPSQALTLTSPLYLQKFYFSSIARLMTPLLSRKEYTFSNLFFDTLSVNKINKPQDFDSESFHHLDIFHVCGLPLLTQNSTKDEGEKWVSKLQAIYSISTFFRPIQVPPNIYNGLKPHEVPETLSSWSLWGFMTPSRLNSLFDQFVYFYFLEKKNVFHQKDIFDSIIFPFLYGLFNPVNSTQVQITSSVYLLVNHVLFLLVVFTLATHKFTPPKIDPKIAPKFDPNFDPKVDTRIVSEIEGRKPGSQKFDLTPTQRFPYGLFFLITLLKYLAPLSPTLVDYILVRVPHFNNPEYVLNSILYYAPGISLSDQALTRPLITAPASSSIRSLLKYAPLPTMITLMKAFIDNFTIRGKEGVVSHFQSQIYSLIFPKSYHSSINTIHLLTKSQGNEYKQSFYLPFFVSCFDLFTNAFLLPNIPKNSLRQLLRPSEAVQPSEDDQNRLTTISESSVGGVTRPDLIVESTEVFIRLHRFIVFLDHCGYFRDNIPFKPTLIGSKLDGKFDPERNDDVLDYSVNCDFLILNFLFAYSGHEQLVSDTNICVKNISLHDLREINTNCPRGDLLKFSDKQLKGNVHYDEGNRTVGVYTSAILTKIFKDSLNMSKTDYDEVFFPDIITESDDKNPNENENNMQNNIAQNDENPIDIENDDDDDDGDDDENLQGPPQDVQLNAAIDDIRDLLVGELIDFFPAPEIVGLLNHIPIDHLVHIFQDANQAPLNMANMEMVEDILAPFEGLVNVDDFIELVNQLERFGGRGRPVENTTPLSDMAFQNQFEVSGNGKDGTPLLTLTNVIKQQALVLNTAKASPLDHITMLDDADYMENGTIVIRDKIGPKISFEILSSMLLFQPSLFITSPIEIIAKENGTTVDNLQSYYKSLLLQLVFRTKHMSRPGPIPTQVINTMNDDQNTNIPHNTDHYSIYGRQHWDQSDSDVDVYYRNLHSKSVNPNLSTKTGEFFTLEPSHALSQAVVLSDLMVNANTYRIGLRDDPYFEQFRWGEEIDYLTELGQHFDHFELNNFVEFQNNLDRNFQPQRQNNNLQNVIPFLIQTGGQNVRQPQFAPHGHVLRTVPSYTIEIAQQRRLFDFCDLYRLETFLNIYVLYLLDQQESRQTGGN